MRKENIDEKALTSATSKWREMDQYKLGSVYVSVHSWKQTWPPTERQVFLILRLYLQILPNILPLFGDFSMHAAILSHFFSPLHCCWRCLLLVVRRPRAFRFVGCTIFAHTHKHMLHYSHYMGYTKMKHFPFKWFTRLDSSGAFVLHQVN